LIAQFGFHFGNKCDLENARVVTDVQGSELPKEIGAVAFFETSAATGSGIHDVTAFIASAVLQELEIFANLRPPPSELIAKTGTNAEKKDCC
jgi:hypothetical protein